MSDPVKLICGDNACFEPQFKEDSITDLVKNRDGIFVPKAGTYLGPKGPVGVQKKSDPKVEKALKEVTDIIHKEFGIAITPRQMLTSGGANGPRPLEVVSGETRAGVCGHYEIGPNRVVISNDFFSPLVCSRGVLRHELAHAVMWHYLGRDDLPRWVVEGFADYVSASLSFDMKMKFPTPPAGNLHDFPRGGLFSIASLREGQAYTESAYAFLYLKEKAGAEGLLLFMEGLRDRKDPDQLFAALTKNASFSQATEEFKNFLRGQWELHRPSTFSGILRSSGQMSLEFFPGHLRSGPLEWGIEGMLDLRYGGVGIVVQTDPLIGGSVYSLFETHMRGGGFLGKDTLYAPDGKQMESWEAGFFGGAEMVIAELNLPPLMSPALLGGFTYQSPTPWRQRLDKSSLSWDVGLRLTMPLPWL